ncbi:flagellar export protein FliJ [Edaphosphingomonas haloaromaticamans]|uniref:Uncharacterized protein n=1 Tax=Edaphosphingomonas haloaromaticamans TaxID=653954 RepID=A0A1S1HIT5_9SPHN|nr:flagellar export protein FliJ [Sphingomonas haloaromaticamans]OHT21326.1 hypothetical protein BHE75_03333 [Sphingomonas haloaromaticamans]
MKAMVRRRERIVRARTIQQLAAEARLAQAEGRLASLTDSADRLGQLRDSLGLGPGGFSAAVLANAGEMAMRLDNARAGLADAIVGARATVETCTAQRLEARIRSESAQRLADKAAVALEAWREKRQAVASRPRSRLGEGGVA